MRSTICLIVLLAIAVHVRAQDSTEVVDAEGGGFHPALSFDLSADGRLRFDEGFAVEQLWMTSSLHLIDALSIDAQVRGKYDPNLDWYDLGRWRYRLAQINVRYRNTMSIFSIDVHYELGAGKIEWYPQFSDTRLVLENIDLYTNPVSFLGGNVSLGATLYKPYRISAYVDAFSGDVIGRKVGGRLNEAIVRVEPQLFEDLGLRVQMGKSQSSIHAINYAYLGYTHTFLDYLTLDIQAGKLIGFDEKPYGAHVGLRGRFEYIELGGYYERRLGQSPETQLLGFHYSVIGPDPLVWFLGTYQVVYDFDMNTLRFMIPVVSATIDW